MHNFHPSLYANLDGASCSLIMEKSLFKGSGVAIVTPFTDSGVDFNKLGQLLEYQIENETDAIIICGTTGEASTMPDEEHIAAIKYTVEKVAKRVPVIAGTGSNDTEHCLFLSKMAEEVGVDGLLIVTPYYNKASQRGLVKHFSYIADKVQLPIILYNVPSRTNLNISVDTVVELSKHPMIVGIKEASGNISYTAQVAAAVDDNFDIYSGNDDMTVPIMSLGGKGIISVAANIIPKVMHDMCWKYLEGDTNGAMELQLKYLKLLNDLFVEVNPIPVKTALNLMGYKVGPLRMPLCEMSEKNTELLKNTLQMYGLI